LFLVPCFFPFSFFNVVNLNRFVFTKRVYKRTYFLLYPIAPVQIQLYFDIIFQMQNLTDYGSINEIFHTRHDVNVDFIFHIDI